MKWNGIRGLHDLAAAVQIHISVRRKPILRDELDIPHRPTHTTSGMSGFHLILDQCDNPVVAPTKHKSAVGGWAVIRDILPDVDFLGFDIGHFADTNDCTHSILNHIRRMIVIQIREITISHFIKCERPISWSTFRMMNSNGNGFRGDGSDSSSRRHYSE